MFYFIKWWKKLRRFWDTSPTIWFIEYGARISLGSTPELWPCKRGNFWYQFFFGRTPLFSLISARNGLNQHGSLAKTQGIFSRSRFRKLCCTCRLASCHCRVESGNAWSDTGHSPGLRLCWLLSCGGTDPKCVQKPDATGNWDLFHIQVGSIMVITVGSWLYSVRPPPQTCRGHSLG